MADSAREFALGLGNRFDGTHPVWAEDIEKLVAARDAELQREARLAVLNEAVGKFNRYLESCPEDHSFGSAQRLGITVCIEAAESLMIPAATGERNG